MGKLLEELKRRNVIRAAVAYAVASWLLLQVADLVLDNISAPGWVMQVFMLALALGFPLVLLFAWVFELTPDGLKREKDADPERSVAGHAARKLDRVIIGLLVLVLLVFGVQRMFPAAAPEADAQVADQITDKSIAVLAFKDLSPEGDQAYFAEGISEELLNALAQIPDLKVAGRTSSFAFKDQNRDLREIGEILHVAHVLEGSVRKSGKQIRVTAQLIKTDDGFHVFSKNYDRNLDDIFEVQDEIAKEISVALRSAIFGDEEAIAVAKPTAAETYNSYLLARQWIHTRDADLIADAVGLLDRALEIDPSYAPAYAQKALALLLLADSGGTYGEIPIAEAVRSSRPLIDRALELDPHLAEAHAVLGLWHSMTNTQAAYRQSIASLRRALEINPVLADANYWLAVILAQAGMPGDSRKLYETVVERDPLYPPAFTSLIADYLQTQDLDQAEALLERVERIDGDSPRVLRARGSIALFTGEIAAAVGDLRTAYEFNPSSSVAQDLYGAVCLALGDYETASEVAYPTVRLLSLELAGRHEDAEALFESMADRKFDVFDLVDIATWYLLVDRPADLVALLEKLYGRDSLLDALPPPPQLSGAPLRTQLAWSLRQLGRDEEAGLLLGLTARLLEDQAHQGADNRAFWSSYAEYAALSGAPETMLEHLRRAVERNYVDISGFYPRAFDPYRGDSRFIELEQEVIRRAKEERRKLGLLDS